MTGASTALLLPRVRGEALRSYVDRVNLLNSAISDAIVLGNPRVRWGTPDWCLPTGLKEFANVYGAAIQLPDAQYWAAQHTLAPYFQSTLSAPRQERLVHCLMQPVHGPRRPLLPIALTEWFSKKPVLCPVCDEEAEGRYGFSSVQRHWLCPFLTRCHIHGEPLAQYNKWSPAARGVRTKMALLPSRAEAGRQLTEASLELLERKRLQLDELGTLLQSRGFTTRGGRLRRAKLCQLVLEYARGRYEHPELDVLLGSEEKLARLLAPLWNERTCLHPVIAHVVASALREESEVEQLSLWESERQQRLRQLQGALAFAPSATAAAKAAGVCVTTAVVRARALGQDVHVRPKKLKAPLRDLVIELLASGAEPADVAALSGLSLVSVYRVLAANPRLKECRTASKRASEVVARQAMWLTLLKGNPGLPARQLRMKAPAVYAYLYRNCRAWLVKVTPLQQGPGKPYRRSCRAPSGAEFALAARLRTAAEFDAMDLPARKTRTALLADAGRPHDIPSAGSLASTVLKAKSESLRSFVYRRLSAAVAHLHNAGIELVPWKVERASGLRTSVIAKSGVKTEAVIADTKAAALRRLQR